MLLRSSSAPILSSLLPYSSHEQEPVLQFPRTISVLCLSQYMSEADLQASSSPTPTKKHRVPRSIKNQHTGTNKDRDDVITVQQPFSISGLDKGVSVHEDYTAEKKDSSLPTSVMGGGMGCNGSGRGSHGGGWDFFEGNNHGSDRTDAYYQNMIEANPNDALLLGNYSKFLKEVRGDYPKAVEYLERAILANPDDGHNLSLYADLIWQTEKNSDRAEGYFDQAIQSAPNDCYVLASYAKFLWDAEEDEDCQNGSDHSHTYPTDLFQGTDNCPHLTAASQALPLSLK